MAPAGRLRRLSRHLAPSPAAAIDVPLSELRTVRDGQRDEQVGLLGDAAMRAFVTDSLVAVRLDDIPASVHREYYETAMRLDAENTNDGGNSHDANTPQALGGELEEGMNVVFRSAKFQGALRSVLGPDYIIGNNWKDDGEIGYSYRMHVSNVGGDQGWCAPPPPFSPPLLTILPVRARHLDGTDHGNTQATGELCGLTTVRDLCGLTGELCGQCVT